MQLTINGETVELDADPSMPLLWALRDLLGLRGTKYGCGIAVCGACTVHLDGRAVQSCVLPLSAAEGKAVTTIEGLDAAGNHPVQIAWRKHNVPQCGYCQPGQIMTASAFLGENAAPTDKEIDRAMARNLCRCGTYKRVRAAVRDAADQGDAV